LKADSGAPLDFACAKIASVKLLLKSLLVWFMLLAVPLQGYASATTMLCAPLETASGATAPLHPPAATHDHRAMATARHTAQMHAADTAVHQAADNDKAAIGYHAGHQAGHHAGGKCNSCSACCFGAVMASSDATRVPVETQQFSIIAFDSISVPAVDLAFPKRPPKALLT
jgi:hypothetical protein